MASVSKALKKALAEKLMDSITPEDLEVDYEMSPEPEELEEGAHDFIVDEVLDFNGELGQALIKWVKNFQRTRA